MIEFSDESMFEPVDKEFGDEDCQDGLPRTGGDVRS